MEKLNLPEQVSEDDKWVARQFVGAKLNRLIDKTSEQLDQLAGSLRNLMVKIRLEKPDIIVFMDKGARVFAIPIHKYLNESLKKSPQIRFTNDKAFKKKYNQNQLEPEDVINKYSGLKNQKVFFIDETFSAGAGASVIIKIKEILGNNNIFYFALSNHDPKNPPENYESPWHQNNLAKIKKDRRFIIYPNSVNTLFSKDLAELYLTERKTESGVMITVPKAKINDPAEYSWIAKNISKQSNIIEEDSGIKNAAMALAYKELLPKAQEIIYKKIYEKLAGNK